MFFYIEQVYQKLNKINRGVYSWYNYSTLHRNQLCDYTKIKHDKKTHRGILLFLVVMAILAWVRFYPKDSSVASFLAPVASTIIIIPCLIIFVVFGIRFYRQLISHKYERHTQGLEELEHMASELNSSLPTKLSNVRHV